MTDLTRCTWCVMTTANPAIAFDGEGRCNLCSQMEADRGTKWFMDDAGLPHLDASLATLREGGQGAEFDCILGLSGGIDSSYVALKLHDWGIRPLVVHVDGGWNTEHAVRNIQSIVESFGWELHTHVVNWEDMRRLQIAYLRSGVPNQDVPQDHAFFAALYHFAISNGIRNVISGGNTATEGIAHAPWEHSAMDAKNITAIWNRFGDGNLREYPLINFFQYYLWYPQIKRMRTFRPLNFIPYRKDAAVQELQERAGYQPYPRKHGESLFTKFFQEYYLPRRMGYDKRQSHLSSLIVSGQMTRTEALEILSQPLYTPEELTRDREYLIRKLRVSDEEFEGFLEEPVTYADEYPSWNRSWGALKRLQSASEKVTHRRIHVYS